LLKLKEAHEDYELVDAYIIARSSSDWTNTITINRGSNAGIEPGMCAITANGEVVGLVTEVGGNFAVIKTVLDSSLEISAMVSASGYAGMVTGGYITGNRDMLRMDYLPSNSVIRNRDQVVTAGSTVYPRNLILGYVVDAGFNDTGVVKYAILEPAADIGSLEQLFILTKYDTQ
jgi:rod shape-determining protein MreC